MNERIRELAIQAGIVNPEWETTPASYVAFANLIVKECVQVLDTSFLTGTAQGIVKNHFRVEE